MHQQQNETRDNINTYQHNTKKQQHQQQQPQQQQQPHNKTII